MEFKLQTMADEKDGKRSTNLSIKEDQVSVLNRSLVGPSMIVPHARNIDTDGPLMAVLMDLR